MLSPWLPPAGRLASTLANQGPGYAFADAGVETMQTEADSLSKLVYQLPADLGSALTNLILGKPFT